MSVKIINIGIKTNVSYNAEGELWNIRCSKFDVQATGKTFKKAKIAFKEAVEKGLTKHNFNKP